MIHLNKYSVNDKAKNREEIVPLLKNHIIFFSGGRASLAAADFVIKKYPEDNILLYFTDTLWENHDTYRFIDEVSDKLQLPLLIHCAGLTPIQLMFEKKLVYNNMIGDCSKLLKMRVASDYLKKGIKPGIEQWRNPQYLKQNNFIENATLYFGIGFEEMHREKAIVKNWLPFSVNMPLIENFIRPDDVLKQYDIREPELYKLGFSHNNCNGRCIKAGQGHYRHLKKTMPDTFKKLLEEEFHLSMCVSAYRYIIDDQVPEEDQIPQHVQEKLLQELDDAYRDYFYGRADKPNLFIHPAASAQSEYMKIRKYSFMKKKSKTPVEFEYQTESEEYDTDLIPDLLFEENEDTTQHTTKGLRFPSEPYTLRDFNRDEKAKPEQIDLFDIGGCGCFVEFDEQENNMSCNTTFGG